MLRIVIILLILLLIQIKRLLTELMSYILKIMGEICSRQKRWEKGKGDAAEDARENRNLLSKIGSGISGLGQATKDTAKAESGRCGLLAVKVYLAMGKMFKGGLVGGGGYTCWCWFVGR